MSETLPTAVRFGLGVIDQVSYAVADIEVAAKHYSAVFGPFEVVRVPPLDVIYRGRPATVTLNLAFGRSGPVEIELVQVLDGESPVREYLLAHGEGVHHVRFPVEDLTATMASMEAAHWVAAFARQSDKASFAYLEPPAHVGGPVIELIQWGPSNSTNTS